MLIAVNFHYVRPEFRAPHPGIHGVTPSEFARQLDTLGALGEFVGAERVREALAGRRDLPERSWLVTFDDGLGEQFTHALPVLEKKGIPAIFFPNTRPLAEGIVSAVHKLHLLRAHVEPSRLLDAIGQLAQKDGVALDVAAVDGSRAIDQYRYDTSETARLKYLINFVLPADVRSRVIDACFVDLLGADEAKESAELYMSIEMMRELAEMDALGTHGHDHVPLGTLVPQNALVQIRHSLDLFEEWGCGRPDVLSYPYGSREACLGAVAPARAAGTRWAITMERAGNADLVEPHLLARCANNDVPGASRPTWTDASIFSDIPRRSWTEPIDLHSPRSSDP